LPIKEWCIHCFFSAIITKNLEEVPFIICAPNACGSADCGRARQITLYTNFASKKRLKNGAVAIRLQPLVVNM
jgi:hypothetical protein